ncbi:hypothetical protein J7E73_12360 [Paenibacillus albidus]|uniref:hypothetical protein n=1 Tax=Paenibacillus albidus TaxID=2041023 RepID=UPI001BEB4669|nr:hypothetical protein [Paenibacillus albidus]MBT2289921.1 hypothetical protein [Paenibacillus albidus]
MDEELPKVGTACSTVVLLLIGQAFFDQAEAHITRGNPSGEIALCVVQGIFV